ncbi:uncharacterized protein LOC135822664 [Sycon ciliatum]|uniref:uncharacterized protein LOC135822664 n=1 Tax=Sycon ciliatum TaxID=27933 RepID=UPI0031F642C2|eukprot:scpid33886/ scgid18493/ 
MSDRSESGCPGEFCREAGLSKCFLLNAAAVGFKESRRRSDRLKSKREEFDQTSTVTNGLVLELTHFMNDEGLAWSALHTWLSTIMDVEVPCSVKALTAKVRRLQAARAKLLKASRHEALSHLICEEFSVPESKSESTAAVCGDNKTRSSSAGSDVNCSKMSDEVFTVGNVDAVGSDIEIEMGEMQGRLSASHDKVRNIGKKLRRRNEKINDLEEKVHVCDEERKVVEEELSGALESVERLQRKLNNVYCRTNYAKTKSASTTSSLSDLGAELGVSMQREKELSELVKDLSCQLELERTVGNARQHITSKVDGKYTTEVRQCCYELLGKNVGVWNVGPVIRSVLTLAGAEISEVPSAATLSQMLVELRQVSQLHVASSLANEQFTTGHCDGTSKQGVSYQGYQMATPDKVFSLGMVEMKSGTAQHVFDTFKQVLGDIEDVAATAGHANIASKLLANMKNTMSDRCIVQKSFNKLVEEYRKEILPDIIDGWEGFSEEERTSMSRINCFYCGMHYIVGLADSCTAALKVWEKAHFGEGVKVGAERLPGTWQGTGNTARLIYSTTKAFEKHGDEAAGCVADFHAFLSETNTPLPLDEYRGNRSYVVFHNGAGIYYLHNKMLHFLVDVSVRDNQLLRAVKEDLGETELIAGARALGILSKLVINPLWCLLEDPDVSVLEVGKYYTALSSKFDDWAKDASDLLDGSARPFPDAKVSTLCDVFTALVEPSEKYDAITLEILAYLCSTLASFSARLLVDHLPGGKYHSAPGLAVETASVRKTNAVSERDFAQLDRLLREKPNADTVALEGMILFNNNETASWLQSLSPAEQSNLIEVARQTAPSARQQFKDRRVAIQQHRLAELKRKQAEKEKKHQATIARKEQLTKEIEAYGLWTEETNIDEKLAAISSVTGQRAALRSQLQFRKFVLEQKASKELFFMSSAGRTLPVATLASNLRKLTPQRSEPGSDVASAVDDE